MTFPVAAMVPVYCNRTLVVNKQKRIRIDGSEKKLSLESYVPIVAHMYVLFFGSCSHVFVSLSHFSYYIELFSSNKSNAQIVPKKPQGFLNWEKYKEEAKHNMLENAHRALFLGTHRIIFSSET